MRTVATHRPHRGQVGAADAYMANVSQMRFGEKISPAKPKRVRASLVCLRCQLCLTVPAVPALPAVPTVTTVPTMPTPTALTASAACGAWAAFGIIAEVCRQRPRPYYTSTAHRWPTSPAKLQIFSTSPSEADGAWQPLASRTPGRADELVR